MKSERGNIIVYLLIGLVLFGMLAGGVWWVKNRVANKPATVATVAEEKVVQPGTDTKVDQDSKPESKPEETKPAETKPAETKPAEQTPSTPVTPAPETNRTNTTSNTASGNTSSTTTPSTSTPSASTSTATNGTAGTSTNRASDLAALPPESQMASTGPSPNNVAATGPLENALGTSLGLGIITFLASAFIRSRKAAH